MVDNNVGSDQVIAELISMGFEFDQAIQAVNATGPRIEDAVEFILSGSCNKNVVKKEPTSSVANCSISQSRPLGKQAARPLPLRKMKQSNIADHLSSGKTKRSGSFSSPTASCSAKKRPMLHLDEQNVSNACMKIPKSEHLDEQNVSTACTKIPESENQDEQNISTACTKIPKSEHLDEQNVSNACMKIPKSEHLDEQNVSAACTKIPKSEHLDEQNVSNACMKIPKSEHLDEQNVSAACTKIKLEVLSGSSQQDPHAHMHPKELKVPSQENKTIEPQGIPKSCNLFSHETELEWEQKVRHVLQKHFGFSSLKSFQKEALKAWLAHKDCLVLAATGSGKSLCFQIPALLTRKIVVVISPLISLMHDQCLKLAKHGISACFLGSGQPDSSVECKAMNGMYKIIYVCPETLLRLIEPLKRLAENPGIALFAIDEVHCVSKWGHDFRPDYRRLSILRESFRACNMEFLKFDIPLMALTATATVPVRDDIINSLHLSKEAKLVLTSFFRPNLRFSVKHSRTGSTASYGKDFSELIETYTMARGKQGKGSNKIFTYLNDGSHGSSTALEDSSSDDEALSSDTSDFGHDHSEGNDINSSVANENSSVPSELTAEYLEDEVDIQHSVDDLDVSCGEFLCNPSAESSKFHGVSDPQEFVGQGPTIIYVPTRKETTKIAEYLSKSGVRAAGYHAKMPRAHLRQVHQEFHANSLEVVVATIAFGMGIDKSNVRRIIHYGWPQSLEAYYQEAGRAGRDGKLSDCTLYANLSRIPTLLPSQRSEEQTKQAYKMLSDCFRYGMNTATCRAKTLVNYFGEEFINEKCQLCDVCVNGPPEMQNVMEEADTFMRVLKAQYGNMSFGPVSDYGAIYSEYITRRNLDRSNFKMVVRRIREQFQKFTTSDQLWWQGLARILLDRGYIREGNELARVSITYPELTELGLRFLRCESEQALCVYPEADMLLSIQKPRPFSSFSEWGRGWADPEIRRQRLQGRKGKGRSRKRKRKSWQPNLSTVRGRLTSKLSKKK